jgi:tRNA (mo5U34)-methyltransferase
VFDLDRGEHGSFDFVFCGSLLLHLKEPIRALERIRGVCAGQLLVVDHVELALTLQHPRRPVMWLKATGTLGEWWAPNAAGLRHQVYVAGFELEDWTRPFCVPFGEAHERPNRLRALAGDIVKLVATGGTGVPHAAVVARPRV